MVSSVDAPTGGNDDDVRNITPIQRLLSHWVPCFLLILSKLEGGSFVPFSDEDGISIADQSSDVDISTMHRVDRRRWKLRLPRRKWFRRVERMGNFFNLCLLMCLNTWVESIIVPHFPVIISNCKFLCFIVFSLSSMRLAHLPDTRWAHV